MFRERFLAGLLAVGLVVGCKAQTAPAADAALGRRIEVMVRSQFNVPPDYSVAIGDRKPSQIPGYDTLPVTLTRGARTTTVEFMISTDNSKLARLETFDLAKYPAFNIDLKDRPIRGNPDAKVTVVNFDDLECPYCARMHQQLFPGALDRYKDKIRIIYKDDPLTEIHPWAMHAAVNANCLAAQNGSVYWLYVDYLHSHGQEINGEQRDLPKSFAALDRIARDEGTLAKLNGKTLDACIARQDESQVKESAHEADVLGVNGTPAVFVDGERIDGGAVSEQQLWIVIDRALRAAGETVPAGDAPAAPTPAKTGSGQ